MTMDPPSISSVAEGKKREESRGQEASCGNGTACETCRARKTRCDEQKPRCGLCQKLDKVCLYQEPKPTKKDTTLTQILETLDSLSTKLDRVLSPGSPQDQSKRQQQFRHPKAFPPTPGPSGATSETSDRPKRSSHSLKRSAEPKNHPSRAISKLEIFQVPARQITEVHKLLAWPAVQTLLECHGANLSKWDGENRGTENWLVEISKDFGDMLPLDWPVDIIYSETGDLRLDLGRSITLTRDYVEHLCAIYFRSFHYIYPILDHATLYNQILPEACRRSFNESYEGSCLVLLVLALACVAQDGATGEPIVDSAGRLTGVRGGTAERPPGLVLLNEAKRRFGASLTHWSLTTLQTSILFAVYYSQVSRNLEFWRMATISCTMVQSHVKSVVQWGTVESDRVARCFWMCSILEGGLTGELGLDLPSITSLQDSVPLPIFLTDETSEATKASDELFIEYHFLAQITLRTLINRTRNSIQDSKGNIFEETSEAIQSRRIVMQELSTQLQNWRLTLPSAIAWDDDGVQGGVSDMTMLDTNQDLYKEATTPIDPAITGMVDFRSILDASLRTRYKYAQYIIWRPYIYQVLHYPLDTAQHDHESCRKALKTCALWPLTFATFQPQRRLVPHLYEYTHTFFGILILIHVSESNPVLEPLLETAPANYEIKLSVELYLTWIRDMKVVHPVARWCWDLLKIIYKDHDVVRDSAD